MMLRKAAVAVLVAAAAALAAGRGAGGDAAVVNGADAYGGYADSVVTDRWGCVTGMPGGKYYLLFSADSMFEGAPYILHVLDSAGVKGNFFFTGNFLERPENDSIVRRIIAAGHYVGSHSDRHLQLADWDAGRTPLVTADSLLRDLADSYRRLARFGITADKAKYTLPPYEWCHNLHSAAYRNAGFIPVAPTPGIETYRDYTLPGMPEYRTADFMLHQLLDRDLRTLDGAMILIHPGTQDARPDKLYHRLPAILTALRAASLRASRLDR